jgi:hypothetical protein
MSVVLQDFNPINNWKVDEKGPKFENSNRPQFIIDSSTNRKYFNEDASVVRAKCFMVSCGTPFVHTVASIVNIAYRLFKILSFANFWLPQFDNKPYSFSNRLKKTGLDLVRCITAPMAVLGLEFAALYGLFRPYDGRKLYASIERGMYSHFILAPCFQPDPTKHAFGGDPNKQNAF